MYIYILITRGLPSIYIDDEVQMQRRTVDIEGCCGSSYETSFALAAVVEVQMALLMTVQASSSGQRETKALEDDLEASGVHLKATWRALAVHFEATWSTWSPLGAHLESRMTLECSRRVPRASRARFWSPLGVHLEPTWSPLGTHLESLGPTWSSLGTHLESRMNLESSRRVPRALRRPESS